MPPQSEDNERVASPQTWKQLTYALGAYAPRKLTATRQLGKRLRALGGAQGKRKR